MNVIKDPVHGYVKLTDLEMALLDSPGMQRLRGIKQLALTNLVYPGANHTRFEHSLGTLHLTGEICEMLGLGKDETAELRAAALLHDVGHAAFSHESEYFIGHPALEGSQTHVSKVYSGENHEKIAKMKVESEPIAGILRKEGLNPTKIASLITGSGLGVLITSGVGSDRMDYLLRDSYYTGVAYGVIDSDRLIHTMSFEKGKVLMEEGGLEAAESLLIARFLMFSTVYTHHAVMITSAMIDRAIELGISSGAISPQDLVNFDDAAAMNALLKDKRAGKFISLLMKRELYKRAFVLEWSSVSGSMKEKLRKDQGRAVAGKIASSAGVSDDEVLVKVPMQHSKEVADVVIALPGGKVSLGSASDLVNSIQASEEKRQRLIIASTRESVKKVEKAAKEILK